MVGYADDSHFVTRVEKHAMRVHMISRIWALALAAAFNAKKSLAVGETTLYIGDKEIDKSRM